MSLSGWAGVMAGIYALAGAAIAWKVLDFNPTELQWEAESDQLLKVVLLGVLILILAVGTAVFLFAYRNAARKGEKIWNTTAKLLLIQMAVPLVAGGLLILILLSNGLTGLMAPLTLLFYGLALYNAGQYTFKEMKTLGLIEVALGLLSALYVKYALFIWALGFGVIHIIYGIYLHYKYRR